MAHKHDYLQPHDATAAPKLLQQAIKEGKVGVDDSEVDSEEEHKKVVATATATATADVNDTEEKKKTAKEGGEKGGDEKKEEEEDHHVHHRVSRVRESSFC